MRAAASLLFGILVGVAQAQSNIDPAHSIAQSPLVGLVEFRPGEMDGARISQHYCAGHLYNPNVGWIKLGAGIPANKLHHQNNSAADFGVNVLPNGAMRGFAYGANIGWLNFEEQGNPRVDWTTGKLHGSIYGANIGWIDLESGDHYVRLDSIPPADDSDLDGLSDAWEIAHAGNLQLLSGDGDNDDDTQSNLSEYFAGTAPLDGEDFLGPVVLTVSAESSLLEWPTKVGFLYQVQERNSFHPDSPWVTSAVPVLVGDGSIATLHLPNSIASTFFRIAAFPPLSEVN